jgi:hypothetical protein
MGGTQGQSGRYGEVKNLVPMRNGTPAIHISIFLKGQEVGYISARIATLKLVFNRISCKCESDIYSSDNPFSR